MRDGRQIVVLTGDFRPMCGGVAEHLHAVAEALAVNAPVTVATTAPCVGAEWQHAYRLDPLPAWPDRRLGFRAGDALPPIRKLHTLAHFARLRAAARRTVDRLRADARDPRVLIGIWDTEAHFWCAACRQAGLPYRLFAYGVEIVVPLYGKLPEWRRRDFAGAAGVIAISEATADLAAERLRLPTRPRVIPPTAGPRPAAGEIARRAAALRRELDVDAGEVLATVARLVPRKGIDLALRSVAELRRNGRTVTYLVAGDGPERAALMRLAESLGIQSSVRWLGRVDELTKWAVYDLCSAFVLPNRPLAGTDWEGFGIVFLEAALSRRAAVGGRNGGTADAVIDGLTGLLVDVERDGALTGALRRLLDDRPLRDRLAEGGERRALTDFSMAALSRRLRDDIAAA
jgi:phosphatidylinositol alpha-1,6-mannosyltransferase